MRLPTFEEYLDRQDIQEYIEELEDAYDTLDKHSSLRIFNKDEFIMEILKADYDSEYSGYLDRCYDSFKVDKIY